MATPSSPFMTPQLKCGIIVRPGSGWFWHETCSPEYARQVPSAARRKTSEHLNRLSQPLLRELDRLSRVEGVSAWSEQFFISIALQRERGFAVSLFQPQHIGSPYQWNGRVSLRDWHHIVREDRALPYGHSRRSFFLPAMLPSLLAPAPVALNGGPVPTPKRRRIDFLWPLSMHTQSSRQSANEGKIYHALKF
jgi:hypothetical protein